MGRILTERSLKTKSSFFSRQFGSKCTDGQITFDIALGIVGPILCFAADPIVFRGGLFSGQPLLPNYQLLAYLVSAVEVVLLVAWLTLRHQMTAFSAPIGGALIGGSLFSALIGFAILPYSLIGILVLVGFAGFAPFLTSFVYLRNGVRALRSQDENAAYQVRFPVAALGLLLVAGLAYGASVQVNNIFSSAVSNILNGDDEQAKQAVNTLRPWVFFSEAQLQPITTAILKSNDDPARQELLRARYFEITGRAAPTGRFAD